MKHNIISYNVALWPKALASLPPRVLSEDFPVAGGLPNSQCLVQKVDLILHYSLHREEVASVPSAHKTWISLDNIANPAAPSVGYSSHTPRASGRGGVTALLVSPSWKVSLSPFHSFSASSFEFRAAAVPHRVIPCRCPLPPPGPLFSLSLMN